MQKKFATAMLLKGKGQANAQIGTTESGKSTFNEALAKSEEVQMMLETREAHGKGSTNETEMIITDCKEVPEEELYILGKIGHMAQGDCNDDNNFLGSVLYSGIKEYARKTNMDAYRDKIRKAFENSIRHPANESLQYKLKDIAEDDKQDMLEILYSIPVKELMVVYEEVKARNPRKGQKGLRIFVELFSRKDVFSDTINKFWNKALEIINKEADELKEEVESEGGIVNTNVEDGSSEFFMVFHLEDSDKKIFSLLLKSEDASKEYLLSDLSLIYRGSDELFEQDTDGLLVVSEHNGVKVRCIRFIDTQGLFHATGVSVTDEAERIVDIMSKHHASTLILTINSMVSDTVKDGYEAIRNMLQEANRDIKVIILFTHWDQYLKDNGQGEEETHRSKFRKRSKIDWIASFDTAKSEQEKYEKQLRETIDLNNSKKKPSIIGIHYAAVLQDSESEMETILEDKEYTYPDAVIGVVTDIIAELRKNGKKVHISDGVIATASFKYNANEKKDIGQLYNNLVIDCMNDKDDKRLYAATVRACNRKWLDLGDLHKSNVAENDWGFENIETKFVQSIRNLVMLYKDKIVVDADKYVVSPEDKELFMQGLQDYIASNQNWGRETARKIGEDAYANGFNKKESFKYQYQYERFAEMLGYTRDNYFTATSLAMNDKLFEAMESALRECIKDYIDENCILVY